MEEKVGGRSLAKMELKRRGGGGWEGGGGGEMHQH